MQPSFRRCAEAFVRVLLFAGSICGATSSAAPSAQSTGSGSVPTLSLDGVQDAGREWFAFVEVALEEQPVFVGGRVRVDVRLGFEKEFFDEHLLQLFRRELDVPVQLQADWLREGRFEVVPMDPSQVTQSLAAMDRIVPSLALPREVRNQDTFRVFQLTGTLAANEPGAVELEAPLMRFAYATRFRQDLLADRVPTNHIDAYVRGSSISYEVLELPEEGRPFDFSGIIGQAELEASVDRGDLRVGESVRLTLRVLTESNLDGFQAPRIEAGSSLQPSGQIATPIPGGMQVVYDLVAKKPFVGEVPSLTVTVFDPERKSYRALRTEPIPLVVRELQVSQEPNDRDAAPEAPEAESSGSLWLLGPAVLVAGGVLLLMRKKKDAHEPDPKPSEAREAFVKGGEEGDLSTRFAQFLGHAMSVPHAHLSGKEAERLLLERGVPSELGVRAARTLDALLGARFGGLSQTLDEGDVRELVEELSRALKR